MTPPPAARDRRALHILLAVYVATAVLVAIQRTVLSRENNFWIFQAAFRHLRSGADLYAAYPDIHSDFFKYSPTFALLFGPFAVLPPTAGYILWASACAVAVWAGIARFLPARAATLALAIAWIAVLGDLQRAQSNALVAGLMVLAWAAFERGRNLPAAVAIAAGGFVKLFPLAAGLGALMRRQWLRFCLILAGVIAVGAALPLVAAAPGTLGAQYASWYAIETRDAAPMPRYGTGGADLYAGLMGQFRVWFGVDWPHWPVQLAGLAVLVLPVLIQRRRFAEPVFRVTLLASLLMFCVLFNHQAESPSYVIAMIGVAIWVAAAERAAWRTAVMVACLVIVNLASTDLMPRAWYREYYVPYLLKTVPLIPAWIVMQLELHGLVGNRGVSELAEMGEGNVARPEPVAHGG
ncbi:MAG: glycosyltransferase family 87 protein [Gemmatimonadota bacterium]|nr:glycosyltransferase family 87 protein [Gemmatimonadota bacterium]